MALFYADCVRRAWLEQLETISVMSSQRIGDVSLYGNANSVIFPGICDNIDPSFIRWARGCQGELHSEWTHIAAT